MVEAASLPIWMLDTRVSLLWVFVLKRLHFGGTRKTSLCSNVWHCQPLNSMFQIRHWTAWWLCRWISLEAIGDCEGKTRYCVYLLVLWFCHDSSCHEFKETDLPWIHAATRTLQQEISVFVSFGNHTINQYADKMTVIAGISMQERCVSCSSRFLLLPPKCRGVEPGPPKFKNSITAKGLSIPYTLHVSRVPKKSCLPTSWEIHLQQLSCGSRLAVLTVPNNVAIALSSSLIKQ